MKHLFVPYEIALQLKEKGFNDSFIRPQFAAEISTLLCK